jgi:pilus assembly protein Flp/PilA
MFKGLYELFADLWHDESGTVAIEYGMLAMLVAMAILGVVQATGTNLDASIQNTASKFQ